MSTKIASLYAEIGADTTKLKAGLNETKTSLGQAKETFKSLAAGATAAIGGITIAALAMKKAFDFGMEGAKILFTQQKFDNLSKSIGTTSDLLMIDLRKATGGLVADSKLAASATALMALGLAKTHDEAVRLSTVAGKLGMDMNELVLTLTNQTIRRFDQLGVSTDGFKERLEGLKSSGMEAGAAFKEAFLQQSELQVSKSGDIMDSEVAPYKQLQTSFQNLKDSISTGITPTITKLVEGLNTTITAGKRASDAFTEHEGVMRTNSETYQEYVDEMIRSRTVFDGKARSIYKLSEAMEDNRSIMNYMIEQTEMMSEAQFYNSKRWGENAEQMRGYYETMYNLTGETWTYSAAVEKNNESLLLQKMAIEALGPAGQDYKKIVEAMQEAQTQFNADLDTFNQGMGQQAVGLLGQRLYEGGSRYAEALGLIDEKTGSNFKSQNEYNLALEAAVNHYAQTGDLEGFGQALDDITDKYGPQIDELDKLKQQAGDALQNLLGIQSIAQGGTMTIKVNFISNIPDFGPFDNSGNSTTTNNNQDGGGPGAATGADFIVPPGYSNDSYPMRVQSGEHVTVTPTSAGEQDDRLESLLISLPRQIAVAVRDAVLQGVA